MSREVRVHAGALELSSSVGGWQDVSWRMYALKKKKKKKRRRGIIPGNPQTHTHAVQPSPPPRPKSLSWQVRKKPQPLAPLVFQTQRIPESSEWRLTELDFNDFSLDKDQMMVAAVRIFHDLGLLKKLRLDTEVRFLTQR